MPSEPRHGTRLRSGGPARRIAVGVALAGARAQAALAARPSPPAVAPGTWQLLGRVPPRTLRCRLGAARGASSCSAAAQEQPRSLHVGHTRYAVQQDRMLFTDTLQRPGHVRCVPEQRAQNGKALRLRRLRPVRAGGGGETVQQRAGLFACCIPCPRLAGRAQCPQQPPPPRMIVPSACLGGAPCSSFHSAVSLLVSPARAVTDFAPVQQAEKMSSSQHCCARICFAQCHYHPVWIDTRHAL